MKKLNLQKIINDSSTVLSTGTHRSKKMKKSGGNSRALGLAGAMMQRRLGQGVGGESIGDSGSVGSSNSRGRNVGGGGRGKGAGSTEDGKTIASGGTYGTHGIAGAPGGKKLSKRKKIKAKKRHVDAELRLAASDAEAWKQRATMLLPLTGSDAGGAERTD
jgi:hypothetical protein